MVERQDMVRARPREWIWQGILELIALPLGLRIGIACKEVKVVAGLPAQGGLESVVMRISVVKQFNDLSKRRKRRCQALVAHINRIHDMSTRFPKRAGRNRIDILLDQQVPSLTANVTQLGKEVTGEG